MQRKFFNKTLRRSFAICMMSVLSVSTLFPIHASDEVNVNEEKTPTSTGDMYEYYAMDEEGNVEIIYLPEVDEAAIQQEKIEASDSFDVVLHLGNNEEVIGTYDTYEEAQSIQENRARTRSVGTISIEPRVDYSNIKYGYVNFHTKPSSQNTYFTDLNTGINGYTNGAYAKDAAFLGYCDTGKTKVKFRQAGVTGCVNASDVTVVNVDVPESVYVSYYLVRNGTLFHQVLSGSSYSAVMNVGPMQSYMKNGVSYFSYDGHYFYTDYNVMIDDYKAGVFTHSINPNQPYYNYYQYLSHRTTTKYTADQLNSYITAKGPANSKFKGMGKYLIEYQNTYGSNALLTLGVGINESAFGVSSIAMAKNNLFGHKAYDSSPGESADAYPTPQASIEDHAKNYVSRDYMDPKDYGKKYYGSNLGNQASGMNVKYASDPYWGEKAAAHVYAIDAFLGNKDFGAYEIGIKTTKADVSVRSDSNTSSYELYKTGNTITYPVVILGEKSGQSVSGNNIWFKIQSDPTLNDNRTAMTQDECVYDFSVDYGYISSYYITPVKYDNVNNDDRPTEKPEVPDEKPDEKPGEVVDVLKGAGYKLSGGYVSGIQPQTSIASMAAKLKAVDKNITVTFKNTSGSVVSSGNVGTGMTLTIVQNKITSNYNIVVYGDVNGDGRILANDYVLIRNHIMGTAKLTGTATLGADVNRDGRVIANDYVLIKNSIMGSGSISQ